jgi:Tol biopolymer transport system component
VVSRTVQSNTECGSRGDRTSRLTFDAGVDDMPIWSPDGSRVVFMSNRKDKFDLYTLEHGAPVTLFQHRLIDGEGSRGFVYDVASDGRFLVNAVIDSGVAPITLLLNWNPGNVK